MVTRRFLRLVTVLGAAALAWGCSSESGDPTSDVRSSSGGASSAATGGAATGSAGGVGAATGGASAGTSGIGGAPPGVEPFSFFLTSLKAMRRVSGSQNGFGGDLRHGEQTGLAGADKICTEIAEAAMTGAGQKQWRAFLSVAKGPGGTRVDAIDRIGEGPWVDRLGRVVAKDKASLLGERPAADADIADDLPNEDGVPNHQPDPSVAPVDNHHVLTGSGADGRLYQGSVDGTCSNWEALVAGRPRIGFSWPHDSRVNWISGQDEGGCAAGVNVVETGGSTTARPFVGSGGGYGGIYCFALSL